MRNNKVKIVVDTNVFIRGIILQDSYEDDSDAIDILSDLLKDNKIELTFSQDTIGELIYITKNSVKHNFEDIEDREFYMSQMVILFLDGYSVNASHTKAPRCADPNDNMFIKAAKESHATYIISDDLRSKMKETLEEYKECHKLFKTEVLTAKEFVDKYGAKDETAATEKKIEDNDIEK